MLDLDAIRRRWAATPWTNGRTPELANDIAALLSELDSLHTVAESRLMRMRTAAQTLIAEIGARGPENVDITAARAVAVIEDLRAEVARLQDLADARLYRARTARITLESVGIPRSEPVDVGAARAAGMIEDLRAEVARLTAALAAAQAAPVVEWHHLPGSAGWERADVGQFSLLLMGDSAWRLICGDQAVIARGSPGGPAGKAACEAAYRRACGLPAIPACAG